MLITLEVLAAAASLPIITANPTDRLVAPGSTVTFTVTATNAESFQWRRNGVDLTDATNASLTITNAQSTNSGYYLAIAKNATGWTPSQMAYLNVTGGGGILPFSNYDISINSWTLVCYAWGTGHPYGYVTNGIARIVAGPQLDQMTVLGSGNGSGPFGPFDFYNFAWGFDDPGYFYAGNQTLTNISPGQPVYYRLQITYPDTSYVQLSTTLKLVAGGGTNPVPLPENLRFPAWIEWPDPASVSTYNTATNQAGVVGDTATLQFYFFAVQDFGPPKIQWRKDGKDIPGATNLVNTNPYQFSFVPSLTLSNLQPADAGVYDLMVFGNNWIASPKISLSVQSQASPPATSGAFQSPRKSANQFLADFIGESGRNYAIECSSNLVSWTNVTTISNVSGVYFFLHNNPPAGNLFYRSRLLP